MNSFDVYTIDKTIVNIDGSHSLIRRTTSSVLLQEALRLCRVYEDLDHIVEIRRVRESTPPVKSGSEQSE